MRVAELIAELCPRAWVVNFTNPAGMVTEAMQRILGDRVVGVCDSPAGLCRRSARALGVEPDRVAFDYAGLNHLGWLRAVRQQGRDLLPELLADDAALAGFEEGRLFGADWIRAIGALPNEYLYYYYFTAEAIAAMGAGDTRGEFVARQQQAFYRAAAAEPGQALALWERTRAERDATYLAEARDADRDQSDVDEGGYEAVALALLAALRHGAPATLILNVRNGSTLPTLPADAVVEVSCTVDGSGARPLTVAPLTTHQLGLVAAVKAVEQTTIDAAVSGSAATAVTALALHPLVDSVGTARRLLAAYRAAIPELAAVLR
jgi:6-phospho-beta-glucosidase